MTGHGWRLNVRQLDLAQTCTGIRRGGASVEDQCWMRWGMAVLIGCGTGLGIVGHSWAQELPPIPVVPSLESIEGVPASPILPSGAPAPTNPQAPPAAPPPLTTGSDPNSLAPGSFTYEPGKDLEQLVKLFINDSLVAGDQAAAVNYNQLYTELLKQSYGNDQSLQELEYNLIRSLLEQYGHEADRFLTPAEFQALLNRDRPPIQAQPIAPKVVYLALPELTPSAAREIRQTLFTHDYSEGIVLDLRGSVAYDPRVVADVARLFLPRSMSPLVVTEDRFGEPTAWDSPNLPIAAGIPLAILVDEQTRQGSVILAAQVGLSGSAVTVGQPTQGSETQTRFFLLPSGAAVEMAVALWRTGDQRSVAQGFVPLQSVTGQNPVWLESGIQALSLNANLTRVPPRPTVLIQEGQVGRFTLGLDTRNVDTSVLGNVDWIPGESQENVFQPTSDLKIFYLQDYILFSYRHQGVVDSYFADRIYMTDSEAMTAEGIRVGSTYAEVLQVYGRFGENGYNEVVPFPVSSREGLREDRYYVNYDAVGVGFIFETGTNQVVGIGLYKPGS